MPTIVIGSLALALLLRVGSACQTNAAFLEASRHTALQAGCAPSDYHVSLLGDALPTSNTTPYLEAFWGAVDTPRVDSGQWAGELLTAQWTRDPRLLKWFQAYALIRQGKYRESFPLLREAGAGPAFLAAGHSRYRRGDYPCAMFNWLLADELTANPKLFDVDTWATSLLTKDGAATVVASYTQALAYQPAQPEWRLMLARALLVLDRP